MEYSKRFLSLGLTLFLGMLPLAGQAAKGAGLAGSPLLAKPVGARPLALGGSYVALTDDALAGLWNPGGLAYLSSAEASLTYQREPGEVTYAYLIYGQPILPGQSLGVSLGALKTADVDFVDPSGTPGSVPGQSDWLLAASYGASVMPFFGAADSSRLSMSGGVTLKYLYTTLGRDTSDGVFSVDAGIMLRLPVIIQQSPLRLGAAWQNAGARVKLGSVVDPVASPIRFGLAQSVRESAQTWTTLSVDTVKLVSREKMELHMGAEQMWKPREGAGIALRAGYRSGVDLRGVNGGIGVLWRSLALDYSIAQLGNLGMVQLVSLGYKLN